MNILILNWRDIKHPLSGGAEISLMEHAKYWNKKGATITWFTSRFKNSKNREKIDNITIVRYGSSYTTHLYFFLYYCLGNFANFDIVIDSFHFIPFFTPIFIRRAKILALINEPAKKLWFKNIYYFFALIGFIIEPFFFVPYKKKQFITASDSIANELNIDYGIYKKNIHIIHHGFTPSRKIHKKRTNIPSIVYASRIEQDKGIEDALHAIFIIKKQIKNVTLNIIGKYQNSKYEEKINNLVKTLKLQKNVLFYGYVSENTKYELLSKSWILIHPSLREGWGLNVIEANSVGTPAVGYNVSGLKDSIIDKKTGSLTNENNPASLANGILKLITDEKLYVKYSQNALAWSHTFSWKKSCEESWSLLSSL